MIKNRNNIDTKLSRAHGSKIGFSSSFFSQPSGMTIEAMMIISTQNSIILSGVVPLYSWYSSVTRVISKATVSLTRYAGWEDACFKGVGCVEYGWWMIYACLVSFYVYATLYTLQNFTECFLYLSISFYTVSCMGVRMVYMNENWCQYIT